MKVKYCTNEWIEYRGKKYYKEDFAHVAHILKDISLENESLVSQIRDQKKYISQLTQELDVSNANAESLKEQVKALTLELQKTPEGPFSYDDLDKALSVLERHVCDTEKHLHELKEILS